MQLFCGFTGLLNFVGCLFFAFFLYIKKPKAKISRAFAFWSLCVAFWSLGYFVWLFTESYSSALFWTRFLMAGAIVIPASFLHFTYCYLGKDEILKNKLIVNSTYIFAICYIFLDFSPLFIKTVESRYWFRWWPVPGPTYHIYQFYFLAVVVYTHILFFKDTFKAKGIARKQLMFVSVGTAIAYLGGSTNFFLWYNIPIPPVLNFLVLGYVALIFYAVLNYGLWDIEVVIKRTLVFAGLLLMVMGIVAIATGLTQGYMSRYLRTSPTLSMILAGLLIVAVYDPTRKFLINLTDRYLFQKEFDYKILLKEVTKEMAAIQSLKNLAKTVIAFIVSKGRIRNAATFVYSSADQGYRLQASRPLIWNIPVIPDNHPLILQLKVKQTAIDQESLKMQASSKPSETLECSKLLESMKAEVAIPSFFYQKNGESPLPSLRSILFLGAKKSDEPYTQEDLDIFFTLAQESAIAIENARLYDAEIQRRLEVEEANRKIQEMELQLLDNERKSLLGKMTGGVAHEVRNPLAYTLNAVYFIKRFLPDLERLASDPLIPEEKRQKLSKIYENLPRYLQSIHTATGRIKSVVQTIEAFAKRKEVDLSHVGQEKLVKENFKFEAINVDMLLLLVLEELRFKYEARHQTLAQIEVDVEKNLPALSGDQNALIQVLFNLLSNAHDAMKRSRERKIVIKTYLDPKESKSIHFEFEDTGCGIPEELKNKVWEYLFSTKKEQGGSGIGLLWCKTIVESVHDGAIWFESEVGRGTTFHLKIPIWSDAMAAVNS